MNEKVVSKIVVKLTYTGPQNKTVPSLIFKEANDEVPIKKFRELNLYYANDEDLSKVFSVSHNTIEKIEAVILGESAGNGATKDKSILIVVMFYINTGEYKRIFLSKPEAIEIMSSIHDATSLEKDTNAELGVWLNRTDLKIS